MQGTSYVVDDNTGRAVFDNGTDFAVIPGNTVGSGTVILHSDRGTFKLESPRLTYDGQQLFFAGVASSDPVLMRSDFSNSAFQSPTVVSGTLPGFVAGTVSETAPRRMVIEVSGSFVEGIENAATKMWTFTGGFDYDTLSMVSQPSISTDGLTLVFAGADLNNHHQIYISTRPTLADAFASFAPAPLFDSPQGTVTEETPFLSADCLSLYYTVATTVERVVQ